MVRRLILHPLATLESASLRVTRAIGTPLSVLVHAILFVGIFGLHFLGITIEEILLILTTAVSLEAIYLSIFIQMSINRTTESLEVVHENVDEIAKDIDEIQEDVEDISELKEEASVAVLKNEKNQPVTASGDSLAAVELELRRALETIERLKRQGAR